MAKNMTTLGEYGGLLYRLNRDRHKLANREERMKSILYCLAILLLVSISICRIFFL